MLLKQTMLKEKYRGTLFENAVRPVSRARNVNGRDPLEAGTLP